MTSNSALGTIFPRSRNRRLLPPQGRWPGRLVLTDAGVRWNDPDIAIPWPVGNPIVSAKDAVLPFLQQAELF